MFIQKSIVALALSLALGAMGSSALAQTDPPPAATTTTTVTQPPPPPAPTTTTIVTQPTPPPEAVATTTVYQETTVPVSAGWGHSFFSLSASVGGGVLINPTTNDTANRSTSATPLSLELLAAFHVSPWISIDAGFVFAHDVWDTSWRVEDGTSGRKTYYAGFRPGMHLYGGAPETTVRPYFRFAIPLTYDNASNTLAYGILLGAGFEARGRVAGFFAELDVTPYFNNNNLIPLELRMGIVFHF